MLTALLLGAPSSALAATDGSAPTASPSPGVFGIGPSNATKIDGRPYYYYLAQPGSTLSDHVAVENIGIVPITLSVYPTDASNSEGDGSFAFPAAAVKPVDAGTWLHIGGLPAGANTIVVKPRDDLPCRSRSTVPANASPGDHAGALIASLQGEVMNSNGQLVHLDQRVATRVFIRISGPLHPKLAIENLKVAYHGSLNPFARGDVTITYLVHNTGNVKLGGQAAGRGERAVRFDVRAETTRRPTVASRRSCPADDHGARCLPAGVDVHHRDRDCHRAARRRQPGGRPVDSKHPLLGHPVGTDPAGRPADPRALGVRASAPQSAPVDWRRWAVREPRTRPRASHAHTLAPLTGECSFMTFARRTVVSSAALGLVVLGPVLGLSQASATTAAVPYTDIRAQGTIGLCDSHGNPLTSGNVADLPFTTTAISSQAPAAKYVKDGKATLYAYQPRKDVDPGEWSGQQLSGASVYSNPAHPMAAVTTGDKLLSDFLFAFPAKWDGLVQLRMYLSATNQPQYVLHYPTVNLKVTGSIWTVVGPVSSVSCSVGKAVSVETLLLKSSSFPTPSQASERPSTSSTATPGASSTDGSSLAPLAGGADPGQTQEASSSSLPILMGLLALAIVISGVAVVAFAVTDAHRPPRSAGWLNPATAFIPRSPAGYLSGACRSCSPAMVRPFDGGVERGTSVHSRGRWVLGEASSSGCLRCRCRGAGVFLRAHRGYRTGGNPALGARPQRHGDRHVLRRKRQRPDRWSPQRPALRGVRGCIGGCQGRRHQGDSVRRYAQLSAAHGRLVRSGHVGGVDVPERHRARLDRSRDNSVVSLKGADGDLTSYIAAFPNTDSTPGYVNTYQLRIKTSKPGVALTAMYVSADILVNSAANTWTLVYPAVSVPTSTTTSLGVTPASPQVAGTTLTLTATVTPTAAAGTVQFMDGATNIGSANVSGGTAQITTSTLAAGTHSLTAVFQPATRRPSADPRRPRSRTRSRLPR